MIVRMKWMTLAALKEDEARIIHALQALSVVQVVQTQDDQEAASSESLKDALSQLQTLNNGLTLLRPYAQKKGLLSAKPEVSETELSQGVEEALARVQTVDAICREKAALRAQTDKAMQLKAVLTPWAELGTPIQKVRETTHTALFTGLLASKHLKRLDELEEFAAVEVLQGTSQHAVLVLCEKAESERVGTLLKQLDWEDVAFPDLIGTPQQAIAALDEEIQGLEARAAAAEAELSQLAKDCDELAAAADAAMIEHDREQAKASTAKTASAFVLEGWVPADQEQAVREAVAAVTEAFHMETRDPNEDEIPPSVVRNKSLIAPYEAVTNLYSRPDPYGIDGTPLMAPFYFLFFGMMLSDTGYGLLLFLGGLFYTRLMKPTGMVGGIARVLTMGGLSTVFCGLMIGTFFGMDWNTVFGTPVGVWPLLFDPMLEPMSMLYLCFGLGLAHMLFGVCVKIYMCIKEKDYAGAIFDNVSWLLVVIGLLLLGLWPELSTIGTAMAVAGGALVLLFAGRSRPSILKRFIKGAGSLYDVTGYLSDMLSYSRVFALGLSTGVIGSVLNTLGGMLYSAFNNGLILQAIGFVLTAAILVGLHLFNLGINVLGSFIHTARLQYVEFYGKFYEAGGRPFTPLGYRTRSVRVKTVQTGQP